MHKRVCAYAVVFVVLAAVIMHPYKGYETSLDHYNLGHCALLFNEPDAAEHYLRRCQAMLD